LQLNAVLCGRSNNHLRVGEGAWNGLAWLAGLVGNGSPAVTAPASRTEGQAPRQPPSPPDHWSRGTTMLASRIGHRTPESSGAGLDGEFCGVPAVTALASRRPSAAPASILARAGAQEGHRERSRELEVDGSHPEHRRAQRRIAGVGRTAAYLLREPVTWFSPVRATAPHNNALKLTRSATAQRPVRPLQLNAVFCGRQMWVS
jgi:hypothetical protein